MSGHVSAKSLAFQYQPKRRRNIGRPSLRWKNINASNLKQQFLKADLWNVHNDDYNDDNNNDGFDVEMESKLATKKRKVGSLILTKINKRYVQERVEWITFY